MKFLNKASLNTPESVRLEFILAGIGNRAFALLIDYTILSLVITVLIFLATVLTYQITELVIQLTGTADRVELWIVALFSLVGFTIYVGYFVFFETLWQGQTPGKRIINIRVIRDDGRSARLAQAVLRSLLRPLDDLLYVGAFMIMLSSQEKRLGDWAAGTLVIQEEKPNTKIQLSLSQNAGAIATLLHQQANLAALLPDDFAVIREYLQRRSFMTFAARSQTSSDLTKQVQTLLDFAKLPSGVTPDSFLEGVYLAYQQQSQPETPYDTPQS